MGLFLLASTIYLPASAQPTVNGLYWGDGDSLEYSAVAVSPAGRGILYAAIDGGTAYALIRVDTTANENVFGICNSQGPGSFNGLDCAMMQPLGWGGNGKNHSYKRLWDSEFSTWEISCTDNQDANQTNTWTWTQNYMSIKSGSSCDKDDDPDLCAGEFESVVTVGTPPPGTAMSTSLVYNMNQHVQNKWDATVGGTRTSVDDFRSALSLDGYPAYSATLDYEWNMNYEISFPIPSECDAATLEYSIIAAHHSPDKDGGGDIVIPPDPTYDLGDNPDSYGTLLASSGPRHQINLTKVILGSIIDAEANGAPSIYSDGDDIATSDDEDGVLFPGIGRNECIPAGSGLPLSIAYASDSTNVLLDAWIDWNFDGAYGAGEKILEIDLDSADVADAGGADGVAEIDLLCAPTVEVFDGDSTYARFRVHLGNTPLGPNGDADNGEVEDYILFVTGEGTIILPVELIDFGALADDGDVLLTWATATETNNAGFYVEQASAGEEEFRSLAYVEGAGTTVDEQVYTYRVLDVEPGTQRFRLKQVDFDGAFEYSPVVEIVSEVPNGFVLEPAYPNPFNPTTNIRFAIEVSNPVTMDLYDVSGRAVKTLYKGVPDANQMITVTIDAAGLASGIYLVRLAGADFATSQVITVLK